MKEGAVCDKIRDQPQADDGDSFSPVLCLERGSGVRVRMWKLNLLTKKLWWEEGGGWEVGGWRTPCIWWWDPVIVFREGRLQLHGSLTN